MRRTLRATTALCLLGAVVVAGCNRLIVNRGEPAPSASILKAAQGAASGVRYEIYWATLTPELDASDPESDLWRFVQEERLDERTRLRLRRNGLRAGVVGGAPPREIVRLLNPTGDRQDNSAGAEDAPQTLSPATGVKRKIQTILPDRPAEINASEVVEQVSLLLADDNGPWGEPFHKVQAIYRLAIEQDDAGGVTTVLTPELHYGEPKLGWSSDETGLIHRPKPMRDRRVFGDLRIEAPLVVGEMLIVTGVKGRSESRLGGFFHRAEEGADGQRKAILVRLVQAPPNPDFVANRDQGDRPDF